MKTLVIILSDDLKESIWTGIFLEVYPETFGLVAAWDIGDMRRTNGVASWLLQWTCSVERWRLLASHNFQKEGGICLSWRVIRVTHSGLTLLAQEETEAQSRIMRSFRKFQDDFKISQISYEVVFWVIATRVLQTIIDTLNNVDDQDGVSLFQVLISRCVCLQIRSIL